METFFTQLFILIFFHCLADYPLQGDFLAQGKNRNTAIGQVFWPYCLSSHAIIHGGFVFIATSNLWLALAESLIHAGVDWLKCEGEISMFKDQVIHYSCKVTWALICLHQAGGI